MQWNRGGTAIHAVDSETPGERSPLHRQIRCKGRGLARPALVLKLTVALTLIVMSLHSTSTAQCTTCPTVHIEDLDLNRMSSGWRLPLAGRSVSGNPLCLKGETFVRGVGTHAPSEMEIDLKGAARRFSAVVGVDDEVGTGGAVQFHVYADGQIVADSWVSRGGQTPKLLEADLTGISRLKLVVTDLDGDKTGDHADWCNAVIELDPGPATTSGMCRLCPVALSPDPIPDPIIASAVAPAEPALHGPRIVGTTTRRPFLFRVPATGERPLHYRTDGLPPGLVLDPVRGVITGAATTDGASTVTLTVSNSRGSATRTLVIVSGSHNLALTPPLGWNSWNVWGTSIDDSKIRSAADALVSTGLADHGYSYINIDDGWQGIRGTDGVLRPNAKFPDMKALGDYVHASGLKLGIYSSPGPESCAGFAGSHNTETTDALTWASWGVDFLKYDWCSYGKLVGGNPDRAAHMKPYQTMRTALDACGRDIVYSVCQYGLDDVWTWGADPSVRANLWRTTIDIDDSWESLSSIGFAQGDKARYCGPGHWNDPDMMVIGHLGWSADPRLTRLTRHEQVTHMSLWALQAAPILLGCDLTALDDFTLALLCNDDVLEVNQDPLGVTASRTLQGEGWEIWSRPLADGTTAVGVFNLSNAAGTVPVRLADLGLPSSAEVRDLWVRREIGKIESTIKCDLGPHGARLLRFRPVYTIRR